MAEQEEDRHLKFAGELDCVPEPLPPLRHSTSHVMAQAVKQLFPAVRVAIGPAIEDAFYYDFRRATPFTPEDLARIEARMRELVKADLPFVREEWARAEAIRHFKEQDEPFKEEILEGHDARPPPHRGRVVRPPPPSPRSPRGPPLGLPNAMILVRELEKFAREHLDA